MKKFTFLICTILCLGDIQAQSLSVAAGPTNDVSCYGGSNGGAFATASGGTTPYTYSWAPGGQTTAAISGLVAGIYTVNVTDFAANTATSTVTISQPTAPLSITATAKFSAVCPGSSDSIFASGSGGTTPYSYLWTGPFGDISNPTSQNTNAYPYGAAYIVNAVNDANGCTASASISITVRPFPYVTIAGPLSPIPPGQHDTLVASAFGATSYLWSNSSTTTSIIVMPSSPTTYKVTATNMYGCLDTASYFIFPNNSGNGSSSGNAISVSSSTNLTKISYSSLDSVVWFSFVANDSNTQIIANSAFLGMPTAHVHRLTLYNSSLQTIMDEDMPDIIGANQIRLDISHLDVGSTYYVRAARTPAHANMAGCNPNAAGECNPSQRWDFQMCFRSVPVFVPNDSASEPPAVSQLYYEGRGQVQDMNDIPRFDIKAYTNNTYPAVYASDSAVSFVYNHIDTGASFIDTVQRVDMVLAGGAAQPSQPVFKMEEDSNAGYLNYFLGFVPNGVPKVEGYSRLVYKNVYPNVDMQVYSNSFGVKLYFVCNPPNGGGSAGNPANIELKFKGANSVNVSGGKLSVATELGNLTFAPGFAYTDSAGIIKPKSWQAYFIAVNSNTVRFNTGSYNTSEPLIIEVDRGHSASSVSSNENLDWSTYFGGNDLDQFNDVHTDPSGNVYAAGYTNSTTFPATNGVIQGTKHDLGLDDDATMAKFDKTTKRTWCTYWGGDSDDVANSITTDARGYVYATGYTFSPDFPLSGVIFNAYQQWAINGGNLNCGESDAFIISCDPTGTVKGWCTFYGGCDGYGAGYGEVGNYMVIDRRNNLYIVGGHFPRNYPNDGYSPKNPMYDTTALPRFKETGAYNDSIGTGFILKFSVSDAWDSTGRLLWATDIGGVTPTHTKTSYSSLFGCTVDDSNNFFVVGQATESGYPVTPGEYNYRNIVSPPIVAAYNAVVTKFNAATNAIEWSTNYGGFITVGSTIATDRSGNAYITGWDSYGENTLIQLQSAPSPAYYQPTPSNPNNSGGSNGFLAEFSPSGVQSWGTYFGINTGIGLYPFSLQVLPGYNIIVSGETKSNNGIPFPSPQAPNTYIQNYAGGNADAFVASFNNRNLQEVWGTDFGGNGEDMILGSAVDTVLDRLYVVGGTTTLTNHSFPLQNDGGYYQPNNNASSPETGFISMFDLSPVVIFDGVNNINEPKNGITVYPNPTKNTITVGMELLQKENIEFILYNMMGEVVMDNTISGEEGSLSQEINLSLLPNGIYLLKVNEGDKFYTKKIIKQY